jgi:hypothetical protein
VVGVGVGVVDVAKAPEWRSFVAVRYVVREASAAESGFPGASGRSVPALLVRWQIGVGVAEPRPIFASICFREKPLSGISYHIFN